MSNKINNSSSPHGLSIFSPYHHIHNFDFPACYLYNYCCYRVSVTKDDLQISSLAHLVKYIDWENDYNEEKIGERVLKAEIDNLVLGLQATSNNRSIISQITQDISNYNSHIKQLDADENTNGSLLSLKNNAQAENTKLLESISNLSGISKIIGIYELVTILLIIATGLGGMSEIARNKLLGYPAYFIGGIGIIVLILITFVPSALIGPHLKIH